MRKLLPSLTLLIACGMMAQAASACTAPQLPAESTAVAEVQSLPEKNGATLYFVPTGMGASSIYYQAIRQDAACKQTPLLAQQWDGAKITLSKPGEDALGCVELTLSPASGIIRCEVNSSASLSEHLTYRANGDTLELLRVIEGEYTDATHQKRTTVYRKP